MNPIETEELLQALAHLEEEGGTVAPPAELLAAFREGRLPPEEAERLEALLAASPAARERLAAEAGIALARPSARVRAAVLAAAPRSRSSGVWGDWRSWAVAAGVVLAVAALVFRLQSRPILGPALPGYEVALTGIAVERSAPAPSSSRVEARPETLISLTATPERGVDGVDLGLYLREPDGVRRLPTGGPIREVENGGAASFEARAAELVGSEPGEYELYLVVAPRGDLPHERRTRGGEDVVAGLEEGGRRRVYPLHIRLLPPR